MSKKKTTFYFRILPGTIIFLAIFIAYNQLSFCSAGKYNFVFGIVIILCNNWILMVVHELGHVVFLILKKIPIISIYVPFVSIHLGNNIKYKILSSWESKGLVIPDIPIISKESEFRQLKEVYANFLLAGPIATIIFYIIQIFCFFTIQYYCPKMKKYIVVLALHASIKTFFLLHNCFKELRNDIGDIVAADRVKEDNFFFASYVYCCYFFSENYKLKINLNYSRNNRISC